MQACLSFRYSHLGRNARIPDLLNANNKGTYQPAHSDQRLFHSLECIIGEHAACKISIIKLVSVAELTG